MQSPHDIATQQQAYHQQAYHQQYVFLCYYRITIIRNFLFLKTMLESFDENEKPFMEELDPTGHHEFDTVKFDEALDSKGDATVPMAEQEDIPKKALVHVIKDDVTGKLKVARGRGARVGGMGLDPKKFMAGGSGSTISLNNIGTPDKNFRSKSAGKKLTDSTGLGSFLICVANCNNGKDDDSPDKPAKLKLVRVLTV